MADMSHIHAKDYKCACGAPAVVFVGLADPDATQTPKCRKCADQWKIDVLLALQEADELRRKRNA